MAHRYRIEPALGLLIDKFEGKMCWRDVLEGIQTSAKDPKFQPGMKVLADLTAADLDLQYKGTRLMADGVALTPAMKYDRIAVVAPGSLRFGIARMFGMLLDNRDIVSEYRVFSDFSEARTWLGLPKDVELHL